MKGMNVLMACVLGCVGVCAQVLGGTIYVKSTGNDFNDGSSWELAKQTVGASLTAATSGDEVWVAAGTYNERITLKAGVALYGGFAGTETALAQRSWQTNVTILDGQAGGAVVTSPSGATATTQIDGFTLRNGTGTGSGSSRNGGGIYCRTSSPTIRNNTITGNTARNGGGIYCRTSSPIITNNIISANVSSYDGGGIYCYDSSAPTISNNTISGNSATYHGGGIYCNYSSPAVSNNTISGNSANSDGGGIYCYFSSNPNLSNNRISANSADYGGGIYCDSSSPVIDNNKISANIASFSGGGIYCFSSSAPTISNNLITSNNVSNDNENGNGGGIACVSYSSPTIANNTVSENTTDYVGGGLYVNSSSPTITNNIVAFNSTGIHKNDSSGTPVLRNNCVFNPGGADYTNLSAGTSDISVDPLFVNRITGDFHLTKTSLCINAGNDTDVQSGWLDMDGQTRINGSHVDLGADEWKTAAIPGDANGDGAVDVGDLGILAANYGTTSGATPREGDFNGDGAVDVGDLGILAANYGTQASGSSDYNTDYAKVFGATANQEEETASSVCSSMGLPMVAGLMLLGLMMVKLED